MAGFALLPDQCCHLQSISMPSRSHPLALQVEEELQKLRTFVASSSLTGQMVCNGLRRLGDLHNYIEQLLHLPHNQQVLSQFPHKKWVEEQLDGSIRLLDLCDTVRHNIHSRKKAQKGTKNCLKSLKQMDNSFVSSSALEMDCDLSMEAQVLKEAREITISLLQSVLSNLFMARPKPKASRWSFVSKALHKRKVACEEHEDTNEAESVDFSISTFYECIACKDIDDVKVQKAQDQLGALECNIEAFETGLECLFRQLIQNRVSLLNILSL